MWTREASGWWAGPDGSLEQTSSPGGGQGSHAWTAYEILTKKRMAETGAPKAKVMVELEEQGLGGDGGAAKKLFEDGYVRITDVGAIQGTNYTALARSLNDIIAAEDGIANIVSKGPLGIETLDGNKFILDQASMQASVEEAKSFADYVSEAAGRGVSASLLGFDLGAWGSLRRRAISYFR